MMQSTMNENKLSYLYPTAQVLLTACNEPCCYVPVESSQRSSQFRVFGDGRIQFSIYRTFFSRVSRDNIQDISW